MVFRRHESQVSQASRGGTERGVLYGWLDVCLYKDPRRDPTIDNHPNESYYFGVLGSTVPGLLSNQGEKRYKLLFHHGSFKKKVLKYGTPKPSV